jgi:hypothetical protein
MRRYGLPIWLTEFNCGDGGANNTASKHLSYMENVLPYLEGAAEIERYSWMSGPYASLLGERALSSFVCPSVRPSVRNTDIPGCALLTGTAAAGTLRLTSVGSYYNTYVYSESDRPAIDPGEVAECRRTKCWELYDPHFRDLRGPV